MGHRYCLLKMLFSSDEKCFDLLREVKAHAYSVAVIRAKKQEKVKSAMRLLVLLLKQINRKHLTHAMMKLTIPLLVVRRTN